MIGETLGPYRILDKLGAGGMGEVYKARDTRLDRDVAVKVLPSGQTDNADARARFDREAKAVAALSHPHILAGRSAIPDRREQLAPTTSCPRRKRRRSTV